MGFETFEPDLARDQTRDLALDSSLLTDGDSLKEVNKSSLSLSSISDNNKEKASNLSTKEDNKNVGMTLRSGKKDKEHPSAYDHMRAEKL